MDKPDIQGFMDGGDMEAVEAQVFGSDNPEAAAAALPGPTLAEVVKSTRRIAYWERRGANVLVEAEQLREELRKQLALVDAWEAGEMEMPLQRIKFHTGLAAAYYRANPPSGKAKNIKLPNGARISCKNPAPTWNWPTDAKALIAAVKAIQPDLVLSKLVESVDKNEIKEKSRVENGQVILVDSDGVQVPLVGVSVVEPPAEYAVDIGE